MNVSKEADAAFMRELEPADPVRFANLMRNMPHAAGAKSLAQRQSQRQKEHSGRPTKYRDDAAALHILDNHWQSTYIYTRVKCDSRRKRTLAILGTPGSRFGGALILHRHCPQHVVVTAETVPLP
jgi:hypothetical protein